MWRQRVLQHTPEPGSNRLLIRQTDEAHTPLVMAQYTIDFRACMGAMGTSWTCGTGGTAIDTLHNNNPWLRFPLVLQMFFREN